MMLRTPIRVLDDRDLPAARALLDRDPVTNVFLASRLDAGGLTPARLGAEVWGHWRAGELTALCYSGANLAPTPADSDAVAAFADRARRQGRRCSSIVGPASSVLGLWQVLAPHWGPARDVRDDQPLLVLRDAPAVAPDDEVRRVRTDEIDTLFPASVSMFTEEVGVSPLGGDGGALYRARVQELVAAGRAFARIEEGRVIFKAEVGAATTRACQIQGVWVTPDARGSGISEAGMAAVATLAMRDVAPVVSLYVNCYNTPARRAYERVGFRQEGTFASILF